MRLCNTISAILAAIVNTSLSLFINLNYVTISFDTHPPSYFSIFIHHHSCVLDLREGGVQGELTDVRDHGFGGVYGQLPEDLLE